MFRKTSTCWLCLGLMALVAMLGLASCVVAAEAQTETELLATLKSPDASLFDKAIACKRLAIVGTEASVPVLASLLDDEKLSHYARYGLEPNPSPKVDQAFVAAIGKLKGRHLIGTINSLANRGKPEAIGPLTAKLRDSDRSVALAAAHAIARLGTPKAATILGEAFSADMAPAVLVGGKTLANQGHKTQAIALLEKLSASNDVPVHVRLAATLQSIDLQGKNGLKTLTGALASSDEGLFATGLRAARLLPATDTSKTVLEALKGAPPARAALLLTLLGDLADPAALATVVKAVQAKEPVVRIAALEALASLGNADQVLLLLDAAGDPSEAVAAQAQKTLAKLPGGDVDEVVLGLLSDAARQSAVIRAIGQRRISEAVPQLLKLQGGPNQLEVIAALGETVSLDQLEVLGKLLGTSSPELREAVQKALHAACYRMPDRDATADKLAGYLAGASKETIQFVMGELRRLGGSQALATVARAAKTDDDTLQNYATDALGKWLDTSAAPVLLDLAKSKGKTKYGIRCLRGYIRLIRQFSMSDQERLVMCRAALKTAERDTEKKLVLEAMTRYPSVQMLELAVEVAKSDPKLKTEATQRALAIAEKTSGNAGQVQTLLAQLDHEPVKVEIIKAQYGANDTFKDVTEILRQHVRGFPLIVLPSASYNAAFGGDPFPRVVKELKVHYRMNGKEGEVSFPENANVLLPMPKG